MECPGAPSTGSASATSAPCHCPVDNVVDERPRKRRRAASDPHHQSWYRKAQIPEPGPLPTLVHDPEFWFEDGSIVLVTQNIGFRVYKRLLSEHSPFFRDLFRIPQPAHATLVEGVPCVVLVDPPEQIRHLLRVLFPTNGHLTLMKREAPLPMDAVAAIVRLSHKYQIDHLLAQGLSLLMEHYTDDFDEWMKTDRALPIAAHDIDAISAINIAHLTGTPSILPLAFLSASRTGAALLRGCLRDGRWMEGLAMPDLEGVINGRAAWAAASSVALARIFQPERSPTCRDERCLKVFAQNASTLPDDLQDMYASSPLSAWTIEFDEMAEDGYRPYKICDPCRTMIETRKRQELKKLWNSLPATFGLTLEGWSTD